jgi:hypothetical protein
MYEEKLENYKLAAQILGLKEENKALKMEAAEQRKTHKEVIRGEEGEIILF